MAEKVKTLEAQLAEKKADSRRPGGPKGKEGPPTSPGRTDAPVCDTLSEVDDYDSDSDKEHSPYPTACDWNPDLPERPTWNSHSDKGWRADPFRCPWSQRPDGRVVLLTFEDDLYYRAAARKLRCPVCDLCKGSRKYRKSQRMKQKSARKASEPMGTSILSSTAEAEVPTAIAKEGAARVCATHREHRRVRFDASSHTRTRLHDDDFLRAFQPMGTGDGHRRN
mmetsp:Transcript_62520/g.129879  ORF Transcript_62520/g.129879 Transcript_62520/m.129879 type:complete len:223 (-) Transcript_62520:880-1548(-)